MKTIFSTACLAPLLMILASCGSTKRSTSAPTGVQEFDQASGSWKPATKIVQAPPHAQNAPLPVVTGGTEAIPQHKSVWSKVGDTARKPLHWVGLAKEDTNPGPPPVQVKPTKTEDGKPVKVDDAPPPQPSPIAPKPGARSLWQRMGDFFRSPFHHGSSN